jgi:hypothetical protein
MTKESKEGLSPVTMNLIAETQEIMKKIFPPGKIEDNPLEKAARRIIETLIRKCLVFILSEMEAKEKTMISKEMNLDLPQIIRLTREKLLLSEEEKNQLEASLKQIKSDDLLRPSVIVKKLNLLDENTPVSKFISKLTEQIKQKPEADEAYVYLGLIKEKE